MNDNTNAPIFTELIPSLYFRLVKEQVASFIAQERDNQLALAKEKGIETTAVDFTIFTDKFKPLNPADLPCVVIDLLQTNYPTTQQYPQKVYAESVLQLGLFAGGEDDQLASQRLDYLLSQVLSICSAERAFNLGTEHNRQTEGSLFIDKRILQGWQRILLPQEENQTQTLLAYALKYQIGYREYLEQVRGVPLEAIVSSLHSSNTFIQPFLTTKME